MTTKNYIVEFSDRTKKFHVTATHVSMALSQAAGQRRRNDCPKSYSDGGAELGGMDIYSVTLQDGSQITAYITLADDSAAPKKSAKDKAFDKAYVIYHLIIEHDDDVLGRTIFDAWKGYTVDEVTAEQAVEIAGNALESMKDLPISGAQDAFHMFRTKKIVREKVGDILAFHAKKIFTEAQAT